MFEDVSHIMSLTPRMIIRYMNSTLRQPNARRHTSIILFILDRLKMELRIDIFHFLVCKMHLIAQRLQALFEEAALAVLDALEVGHGLGGGEVLAL